MNGIVSRLTVCLLIGLSGTVWATDALFLPGDAYFHTRLTKSDVEALRQGRLTRLPYVYPERAERAFCGSVGYSALDARSLPPQIVKRICDAYDQLRKSDYPLEQRVKIKEDGTEETVELNPIHVFFYAKTFEIDRFRVGFRYNESWPDAIRAFRGMPNTEQVNDVHYESYASNRDELAEEWSDASLVPALPLRTPVASGPNGLQLGSDLQVLALGANDVRNYMENEQGFGLIRITVNKSEELLYWDDRWQVQEHKDVP
jgi:hypothetical protein